MESGARGGILRGLTDPGFALEKRNSIRNTRCKCNTAQFNLHNVRDELSRTPLKFVNYL